jgi:hypothetical protein
MQNTETPFDDKVERVMASLPVILQSYSQLQRHRYSVDISKYTTSSGITTLTLRKLMSFGDIVDEDLLALYDKNLREDVAAKGFTSLVQLTWNRNSYEGNRKFTFDLTASAADILELSSAFTIKHRTANSPPATENPSVAERVVPLVTPSLKRPRIQKKLEYSLVTLSRYSKDIETKFLTLVQDTLKSANDELRQQVIKAVIARLESRFQGFDIEAGKTNNLIVANIKGLVTSMTKFGRNDREQIRFKENIALAISGTISYQRLIEATGLSRRQLENGRKVREEFDDETEKAEMETVPEEESHLNIEDNDDSEADSEEDSGDESDESDDDDSILEPQNSTSIFSYCCKRTSQYYMHHCIWGIAKHNYKVQTGLK